MKTRNRVTLLTALSFVALLTTLTVSTLGGDSDSATNPAGIPALPPPSNGAISPQNQADALHFVIAADREMYCRAYIALQAGNAPSPDANTGAKPGGSWPSPCEMFRSAAESIQSQGAEFSYALRSLNPINPRNAPQTELEQQGLAFVTSHPTQNFYGPEMLGGRRYVTAVYPDLPAAAACVDCHNRRLPPAAPRLRAGEPMGAVVVRVPLEF